MAAGRRKLNPCSFSPAEVLGQNFEPLYLLTCPAPPIRRLSGSIARSEALPTRWLPWPEHAGISGWAASEYYVERGKEYVEKSVRSQNPGFSTSK